MSNQPNPNRRRRRRLEVKQTTGGGERPPIAVRQMMDGSEQRSDAPTNENLIRDRSPERLLESRMLATWMTVRNNGPAEWDTLFERPEEDLVWFRVWRDNWDEFSAECKRIDAEWDERALATGQDLSCYWCICKRTGFRDDPGQAGWVIVTACDSHRTGDAPAGVVCPVCEQSKSRVAGIEDG